MADPNPPPADEPQTRIGRLISKYPTFVSSFVLGVAGLIATSIWQYRQQQTQRSQAEATQKVAETQAANSWKIERTDVLAKNLNVLAQTGPGTADQRYGVLLSLMRADIIDPELAMSYSLELGKDNTEYMVSVLANTPSKDYTRIARSYTLSCEARYGISPPLEACTDVLEPRSQALGELVAQEVELATPEQPGPLVLFKDERRVQLDVQQLAGLFETALVGMYDRRQWDELAKVMQFSPGAHLVASLVLAGAHTGEFVTDDEAKTLGQLHAAQTTWLDDYLFGKTCDAECKARMIELMITHFEESQGDFDAAMRKLVESPRALSGIALSRLHTRLLWCQVDDTDLAPLRDHVLVPAAHELFESQRDLAALDSVLSLLAMVAEPTEPMALAAWNGVQIQLAKHEPLQKAFRAHRALAARQRSSPPAAMRKVSFCSAPPAPVAPPPPAPATLAPTPPPRPSTAK